MEEGNVVPLSFTAPAALRQIKLIAQDSDNIIVVTHGLKRGLQRAITRPQIEACIRKGTIIEGPFLNDHGNWQVTMFRHAAGEEMSCVVAIDWPSKLIVVTVYRGRK
jgi:hypothetical protein